MLIITRRELLTVLIWDGLGKDIYQDGFFQFSHKKDKNLEPRGCVLKNLRSLKMDLNSKENHIPLDHILHTSFINFSHLYRKKF